MSDENRPGDVPPDLPPEYAEAYRRGYERAFQESDDLAADSAPTQRVEFPPAQPEEAPEPTQVTGPLFADEAPAASPPWDAEPTRSLDRSSLLSQMLSVESDAPARPVGPAAPAAAGPQHGWQDRDWDEGPRERPAWLVPLVLSVAAVVLILLAFAVGKWVAGALSGTDTSSSGSGSTGGSQSSSGGALTGQKYTGPVKTVAISGASASCQARNGVDASGNSVSYAPRNMIDGDPTTAWRCDGDGPGQKIRLRIPAGTKIGEVGLVPGYAKTDPASGADRYAENDRITKVRWTFDNGKNIVQTFDASTYNRAMQTVRIPETGSSEVIVQILGTSPGPRHTTAISEVRIASPRP